MHLKKLIIKNFLSHVDSVFEYEPITSIIGGNSAGKTNILRALKTLLHHGDWPAEWIRFGQDSAYIELELLDGTIVKRERTKTKQSVTITANGKTEVFEGKKDATEFVQKAIGIRKIVLDETSGPEDLNFVDVHDGPYLIGSRADVVQRKVAGLVGANKIDDARARLAKRARQLTTNKTALDSRADYLQPIISVNEVFLNTANNIIKEFDKLNETRDQNQTKIEKLNNFKDHIFSLTTNLNVVKSLDNIYSELIETENFLSTTNLKANKITQLKNKFNILKVDNLPDTTFNELESIDNLLIKTNNEILTRKKYLEINSLGSSIKSLNSDAYNLEQELEELEQEKILRLKELGLCPVCNQPYHE